MKKAGRDPKFKSLADFLLAWTWDERPFLGGVLGVSIAGMKRDPLAFIEKKGKEELRKVIVNAERFVLSDTFLERTMERSHTKTPQEALALADLAMHLPTGEKPLLIEFDANVAYRKRIELGTVPGPLDEEISGRDGYLFRSFEGTETGWTAMHVSDTDGGLPLWPAACTLSDRVLDVDTVFKHANPVGLEALASAWGFIDPGTASGLARLNLPLPSFDLVQSEGAFAFAACKELLERGYARPDPYFMDPAEQMLISLEERGWAKPETIRKARFRSESAYVGMSAENAGSLRFACAALAGISVVPTTRVVRRLNSHFQHRLRKLPNLDVTSVDIDARPGHERAVYENSFKTAIHHRLHDVRGHWRDFQRGDRPFCEHEIVDRDAFYALCGKCSRLLRWVVPHERGDEKLGRVIHDHYEVKG